MDRREHIDGLYLTGQVEHLFDCRRYPVRQTHGSKTIITETPTYEILERIEQRNRGHRHTDLDFACDRRLNQKFVYMLDVDSLSPRLSAQQKARLCELERVVEGTLNSFLECGRALLQIRDEKLYTEHYRSFEDYCIRRWGLTGHRGRELIRSTLVAETLLRDADDAPLPTDLAENVMRSLARLRPRAAGRMLATCVQGHRKANSFRRFENRPSRYVCNCRRIHKWKSQIQTHGIRSNHVLTTGLFVGPDAVSDCRAAHLPLRR
jgi:hypothetical protein